MASRVLSIEVGSYTTRAVEMDYKSKSPKIYNFFSIPTPDGILVDGAVQATPEFLEQLQNEIKERNIRTKKVIFIMNSVRIANREVPVPLVKENKIHDLLIANSSEFFPVDLEQYQLVHNIIEKDTKEKKYRLSVLAVPIDIIASYTELAAALNLEIEALDYIGNSVVQGMLREFSGDVRVTLKVDELSSLLTIMNGEKVELQRNISYGISDAIETVIESGLFGEELSFEDGMNIMRRKTLMFRSLEDDALDGSEEDVTGVDTERLRTLREDVTESMRALMGNIGRILDYYLGQHPDTNIKSICLLGIGADCSGLSKLLTNELSYKVKPLQKLQQVAALKTTEEVFATAEYFGCLAATFQPMNISTGSGKGKAGAEGSTKSEMLMPAMVCIFCLVGALGLAAFSIISTRNLQKVNQNLKAEIEAYQPAQLAYDTYLQTKAKYDDLQNMNSLTKTANDRFLEFLDEMELYMPKEMTISGLTAGAQGITMNITVASKEAAALILQELNQFKTLSSAVTTGISEANGEGKTKTVSFSVSCTYAAPVEPVEETDAGEAAAAEETETDAGEAAEETETDAASEEADTETNEDGEASGSTQEEEPAAEEQ